MPIHLVFPAKTGRLKTGFDSRLSTKSIQNGWLTKKEDGKMKVTRKSPISGEVNELEVPCTPEQLKAWQKGTFIQRAMPDVPAELREFLMTGITPEEWDSLFGGDE